MTEVQILGVGLTAQNYEAAITSLLDRARSTQPSRIHFVNVHNLIEARRNPDLRAVFESAWMRCTDGMPLAWIERRRGVPDADRVSGPDVMLSLCDRGRAVGLRHYFIGGQAGVVQALSASLERRFPGLEVVGVHTPPFRPARAIEDPTLIESINAASPDVVWVGLGAPKQEFWAADHEERLNARLIVPVGAAFDFLSGRVRRAPTWMQRAGLEWLFRLAMDPRRLAGRYVTTNATFLGLLAWEALHARLRAVRKWRGGFGSWSLDRAIRRSWLGRRLGSLRHASPTAYVALRSLYRRLGSGGAGLDAYQRHAIDDFLRDTPRDLIDRGVLEIGSDTKGRALAYLVDHGAARVVGLNPVWTAADAERVRQETRAAQALRVALLAAGLPADSFGAIFSVAVFEHLLDFDACLAEMHRLLVPGGRVYAAFGPIWSSSLGHHVFVDRGPLQLRHWDPRLNPIEDHGHLLQSPEEMRSDLRRKQGAALADAAVEWIFEGGELNRLFFDQYLAAFKASRFRVVRLETDEEHVSPARLSALRDRHPGYATFNVRNATVVLEKPAG